MGCFVRGVRNGMGCFVPGCFVLHKFSELCVICCVCVWPMYTYTNSLSCVWSLCVWLTYVYWVTYAKSLSCVWSAVFWLRSMYIYTKSLSCVWSTVCVTSTYVYLHKIFEPGVSLLFFYLILYVPSTVFQLQRQVFLCWTRTKLGLMFLLKDTTQDAGEAWTRGPSVSSQALYHWATALPVCEPLCVWLWPMFTYTKLCVMICCICDFDLCIPKQNLWAVCVTLTYIYLHKIFELCVWSTDHCFKLHTI